jgi:putative NIF3 family GTP cyclohydrolase 1 type 2
MKRRDFIRMSAAGGGMLYVSGLGLGNAGVQPVNTSALTAAELQDFLLHLMTPRENTVDRIIYGDPSTKVNKIATCWMPYWKTCREAVDAGVNVLVCHEPTFYTHRDLDEKTEDYYSAVDYVKEQYLEQVEKKKEWLKEKGLVVIRNHDTIDALAEYGMPFALGGFLGFSKGDIINSRKYYNVYKTAPQKASVLAKTLASKLTGLNQPGVAFYGDPDITVSSVGIGTGCACDPLEYGDLKPDMFVAIDDTIRTWTQTVFAEDTGQPLVVINHGTSEEMGMRSLNGIIRQKFPMIEAIHIPQGCSYSWIPGK